MFSEILQKTSSKHAREHLLKRHVSKKSTKKIRLNMRTTSWTTQENNIWNTPGTHMKHVLEIQKNKLSRYRRKFFKDHRIICSKSIQEQVLKTQENTF